MLIFPNIITKQWAYCPKLHETRIFLTYRNVMRLWPSMKTGVQNPIEIVYLSAKLNYLDNLSYEQPKLNSLKCAYINTVAMVLYLSFFLYARHQPLWPELPNFFKNCHVSNALSFYVTKTVLVGTKWCWSNQIDLDLTIMIWT